VNALPVTALGAALLASLAWGASQRAAATTLRSELAAEDLRAHRLELEVQRLTESIDALQDEWHTLNVVHHAIDLGPELSVKATATGVTAPQAPAPAFLNINSIPPSVCILDGRLLGDTPQIHVQVSPGRHTVHFATKETDATVTAAAATVMVSVAAGETRAATARLPAPEETARDGF
jgi:hypothetical protein